MSGPRVFFPQSALEAWMADGRAEVEGDRMTLDGATFELTTSLRVMSEVGGEPDAAELVGTCKTLEQIGALGGEHCADSVILGDNAYEVVEGFLAEPVEMPEADDPSAAVAELFRAE